MNTREFEAIQKKSDTQPNECSCNKCADMCKICPCLGTPSDILALIEAGHADKMEVTQWAVGAVMYDMPIIPMVQLRQLPTGHCVMLKDNLCMIAA